LPDFFGAIDQNGKKITKWRRTITSGREPYQKVVKRSEWPLNIPTMTIPRLFKTFPNWDFWFENIPSGNPDFKFFASLETNF
jgi:hypothetical protein